MPKVDNEDDRFMSLANTRARLRMTSLYYFAGLDNLLVAGTGNKVEDFGVGFYTKYGDGGVDLSPIAWDGGWVFTTHQEEIIAFLIQKNIKMYARTY